MKFDTPDDGSDLRSPVTIWTLVGLVVILFGGTGGYMYIEGWSALDAMWMIIISMTTIGYGEPQPLSDAGRIYTMGLIVVGLSLATHQVTHFTRYVVGGGLRKTLTRRKLSRLRRRMRNHHVVIGYGRLGREVAQDLMHSGADVLIIDEEAAALRNLPAGAVHIIGDAGLGHILEKARVAEAAGIAIATGDTATNVYVTLAVRQLNPKVPILTRCDNNDGVQRALTAGATSVVQPYAIGGIRMAQALLHPTAHAVMEHALARETHDVAIHDLSLSPDTPVRGSLAELDLGALYGVIVIAIRRRDGTSVTAPRGDTPVGPGDTLVVVGSPVNIARLRDVSERALPGQKG